MFSGFINWSSNSENDLVRTQNPTLPPNLLCAAATAAAAAAVRTVFSVTLLGNRHISF